MTGEVDWNNLITQGIVSYTQTETARINTGLAGTTATQQQALGAVSVPSQPQMGDASEAAPIDKRWLIGGAVVVGLVVLLLVVRK